MRAATIVGILLILVGVVALAYGGITYTNRTDVVEIGPIDVEATERETIPLPPILGGLALVGGIALVAAGARKR